MPTATQAPEAAPQSPSRARIDTALIAVCAGCWASVALFEDAAQLALAAIASSLTTVTVLRPWHRRPAQQTSRTPSSNPESGPEQSDDVTEKKELQTKLMQSERLAAVGELAAGVAHEINNPINTMINCAQLIQDGDEPSENASVIIEEGGRIADIVRALLQFARDDSDQAVPTSLPEAVDNTMSLIGENWVRHGITATVDINKNLPLVLARPQKIQQILLNLLINAKDALLENEDRNRHVALSAKETAGGVELRISDNGAGIKASIRDRLFEPFITTKRALGGTGLGLSVARSILEDYGGKLELGDADNDSCIGAEFIIWLPLAPTE